MVDFEASADELRVQAKAREFAQGAVVPEAAELDATERFPRELLRGLADLGLMAIHVRPELGGAGASTVAYALAMQEIASACASTGVMASVTNMVCETIARFGTPAQAQRHCVRLANGSAGVGSFALSEPDAGSDPAAMKTTARRDGGAWVIEGRKQWITGGAYAGVLLVWARTSPASPGKPGISCFLVEGGTKGLSAGRPEDKMGIRASNTVPLELDGCRVAGDALLGSEGGGFQVAMAALDGGRIGISSQALGIARAAFAETVTHLEGRRADGAAAEHQGAEMALADMRTAIDAAHLLSMRAAWSKDRGVPFSREAAMAKVAASETAVRVCEAAVRMQGPRGYLRGNPAERHMRDARVTMIYEGTSEIQRVVIARAVLGGALTPPRD